MSGVELRLASLAAACSSRKQKLDGGDDRQSQMGLKRNTPAKLTCKLRGSEPATDSERFSESADTARLVVAFERVMPDAEDSPTPRTQRPRHEPVPRDVACYFCTPKSPVAARALAVRRAAVPETTVHEHGETQLGKNEVRFAKKRVAPSPTGDSFFAKQCHEAEFGAEIALAPHPRHQLRTLGLRQEICHNGCIRLHGHPDKLRVFTMIVGILRQLALGGGFTVVDVVSEFRIQFIARINASSYRQ